eukprot:5260887-Ditylum_brightwellii.AAC.1
MRSFAAAAEAAAIGANFEGNQNRMTDNTAIDKTSMKESTGSVAAAGNSPSRGDGGSYLGTLSPTDSSAKSKKE